MTKQPESLTAGVVKWLNSEGVSVEFFAARTFMLQNLDVTQGRYLPDLETPGKSREVDVIAAREVRIPDKGTIGAYLVVECKYTPKPWVILRGRPEYESAESNLDRITTTYGREWLADAGAHPAIRFGDTFQQEARPGHALVTAHVSEEALGENAWASKSSQDSAYPAIMAATKHAKAWADHLSVSGPLTYFGVVFPVVVVRGPLYEASLDGEQMTANPIASGQVYWDHPIIEQPVLVDIVTERELGAFTRRFSQTAEALVHNGKESARGINTTGIY